MVLKALPVQLVRMVLPADLAQQGPMEPTEQMVLLALQAIKGYKV
jgi:hypothetical protein